MQTKNMTILHYIYFRFSFSHITGSSDEKLDALRLKFGLIIITDAQILTNSEDN